MTYHLCLSICIHLYVENEMQCCFPESNADIQYVLYHSGLFADSLGKILLVKQKAKLDMGHLGKIDL